MSEEGMTMFQGIEVDPDRLGDDKYRVKKTLQILENPNRPMDHEAVQDRLGLIRGLEKEFRTQFSNTADWRDKGERYLDGYDLRKSDPRTRLRKARKKFRLSQKQLAEEVGYSSHVPITQMERGKRQVSKQVLTWLEERGM